MIETIRKICIVGGGNVGLSCVFDFQKIFKKKEIYILTKKCTFFNSKIQRIDPEKNLCETIDKGFVFTNEYDLALKDADLVVVSLPSFCISDFVSKLESYNPKIILYVPGYGNKDFFSQKFIKRGVIVAGFDRSPYVCRIIDNKTIYCSKKNIVRIATVGNPINPQVVNMFSLLFGLQIIPLSNYYVVNFTPSNPILHTSRLYSLFKDANCEKKYKRMIKFYSEWDDFSSEIMLGMNSELQDLCSKIEKEKAIDLSEMIFLNEHYEVTDSKSMTKKLRSINSLSKIESPMLKKNNSYFIDLNSRYFKEDFKFGLYILKLYADHFNIKTPNMDLVLIWYQNISGEKFFDDDGTLLKLFSINI